MTCFEWLKQTAADWYGLEVTGAVQVRDAWRLDTQAGPKSFKQVDASVEKVRFVAAAVQHIIDNGFSHTVPFIKASTGQYVLDLPEGVFYLTDWIPGREGDFSRLEDVLSATRVLAEFHKSSRGFVPPDDAKSKESWGELPAEWQNHLRSLEHYREIARGAPNDEFNSLYLHCCDKYLSRCTLAIKILAGCDYPALVDEARKQGGLCHRDYTYHNFIVDPKNKLYLIDFDYCTQEIRTYDIGRYARKVAKHFAWQLNPVKLALEVYDREAHLSSDEIIFILAFLHFPQRFWRIVSRHFVPANKGQDFLRQLRHELKTQQAEENFLQLLAGEISRGVLTRR